MNDDRCECGHLKEEHEKGKYNCLHKNKMIFGLYDNCKCLRFKLKEMFWEKKKENDE
jgi:hypothetical protein